MRILITGNMGYVGPVVVRHLRHAMPSATIIGFDAGYFAHCLTGADDLPEAALDAQHFGDVRALPAELLNGVTAVVHLAAVSNDPIGAKFETVTHEINQLASIRLAALARDAGVKSFVFASSCSIYGAAGDGVARTEADQPQPLTAYARSKVGTEQALRQMPLGDTTVTCLRFATACGMSDRLRLDLVLNDFVAAAVAQRHITILSDGTPWRPLIDVTDMARAIEWAISRDADTSGAMLSVNVGANEWNYQVKELAEAVRKAVPGTRISINPDAPPDKRSYRVDFRLFEKLAPHHQPQTTLDQSIARLTRGLEKAHFRDGDFRNSSLMRLKSLEQHMSNGTLQADLRWTRNI